MDTPRKANDVSDEGSERWTPFRERAIEERRLKDELLLSATPGLKRRIKRWDDERKMANDPQELKSYLRDLSTALAVQKRKNLTSVLIDEDRQRPGEPVKRLENESDSRLQAERGVYLKDSVFSLLQASRSRSKVRRVESPIVIQEADGMSSADGLLGSAEAESNPESTIEVTHPLADIDSPDAPELPVFKDEESMAGDSEVTDSEPEEPEPLSTSRIRRCLRLYTKQEDLKLSKGAWSALQRASESLVGGIAKEMRDDEGRIMLDRQNILRAYEKFKLVTPNSGNEALFEICCKYLTLEDMNKLEAALFL